MKIICIDNFGREAISDFLIADNVNKYYGEKIVQLMQAHLCSNTSPEWFILVDDDYELYQFNPNK